MYSKLKYVIMVLFCCSIFCFGQSRDTVGAGEIEVGLSLSYYHPNLDDLNSAYAQTEASNSLSPWNNFEISYLVLPTVIYHLDRRNQIAVQAAGSYIRHDRESTKSYYYVWMIGGEYRYMTWLSKKYGADLCVSGGGGIITAKFHRSYVGDIAIGVLLSTIYINAGATLSVDIMKQIGVKADLRYLFSPTKSLENPKCDLSLKSFTAGIGIFYSL